MKKKNLAEEAVALLNEAFAADPQAVLALIKNRVPCNFELSEHPQIVVREDDELEFPIRYSVSAFGILTGVVERLTGHRLAHKWDDGKLVGFCLYAEPSGKINPTKPPPLPPFPSSEKTPLQP